MKTLLLLLVMLLAVIALMTVSVGAKKKEYEPIIGRGIYKTTATFTIDFRNDHDIKRVSKDSLYVIIPYGEYKKMKIKIK